MASTSASGNVTARMTHLPHGPVSFYRLTIGGNWSPAIVSRRAVSGIEGPGRATVRAAVARVLDLSRRAPRGRWRVFRVHTGPSSGDGDTGGRGVRGGCLSRAGGMTHVTRRKRCRRSEGVDSLE